MFPLYHARYEWQESGRDFLITKWQVPPGQEAGLQGCHIMVSEVILMTSVIILVLSTIPNSVRFNEGKHSGNLSRT